MVPLGGLEPLRVPTLLCTRRALGLGLTDEHACIARPPFSVAHSGALPEKLLVLRRGRMLLSASIPCLHRLCSIVSLYCSVAK